MTHAHGLARDPAGDALAALLEQQGRTLLHWLFAAQVVLSVAMYVGGHYALGNAAAPRVALVLFAWAATGGIAVWLAERRPHAGLALWLAGLLLFITLAAALLKLPAAVLFYVLAPVCAALALGWAGGLAALAGVALILAAMAASGLGPPDTPLLRPVLLACLCGLVIAGLARHVFFETVAMLFRDYEAARAELETAREQRLSFRRTEEELVAANRELARLYDRVKALSLAADEARQAKEAFVANVSHELRTPLNMIIGFSNIIPKLSHVYGAKLPPALLSDISAIRRNAQHLARLVDDVLDLSQIDAGRMALNTEWVNLGQLVEEATQSVAALFESKHLYLRTDLPSDLPQLYCDGTRIRQVLLNLISNAGRYTERGGVEVTARLEGNEVMVCVADTGPGISPADQERLFQPFQQGDTSLSRQHGGSGLGLAISKRFVEMHGGRMWLTSEPRVGTTVCFTLPLSAAAGEESAPGARRWFSAYHDYEYRLRREPSLVAPPAVTPRLVVVEETESMSRLLRRYAPGVEVVTLPDMAAARADLGRSPSQGLIVNAPPLAPAETGWPDLAGLPAGTPAIRCWLPGQGEAARQLGVVRYLVKPISEEVLLESLAALGPAVQTILLVDDDLEVLQLFTRMLDLAERGYRVIQAKTGQRALDLLRTRRPDVLLLDLSMPVMDGFQVLREKQADPAIRDIPVITISARDPTGAPVVSESLTITQAGGLSVREVLALIQVALESLAPGAPRLDPEPTGTPPA